MIKIRDNFVPWTPNFDGGKTQIKETLDDIIKVLFEHEGKLESLVGNKNTRVLFEGHVTSEDGTCYVFCECGEQPFVTSHTPKICKCGRIYQSEFRVYVEEPKIDKDENKNG